MYHGAAVGLVRGKAGLAEYSDEAVNDPQVKRVRERTTAVGDPSVTEDQARSRSSSWAARRSRLFVKTSLGNLNRPMTDRQLNAKFRDQAVLALPAAQVDTLLDLCWRIDGLADVKEIIAAAVPAATAAAHL